MRKILLAISVLTVLVVGGIILSGNKVGEPASNKATGNMKILSSAFENNGSIPSKYTCDAENINPSLTITDTPVITKSLALIMDDPDAPAGTWVHWTIWNISPKVTEIGEDSVQSGSTDGLTSFGKSGYGGPCPHSGTHHYFFKVYGLDTRLDLSPSSDKSMLEKAMAGHILEQAELVGLYRRR